MSKHLTPGEIRQLPVTERLQLIEEIWDSLDGVTEELPLPEWHRSEIDKRVDALDQGKSTGSAWDEVRRRITSKP
jgi:putative addiction module component (TIGR02574 family)